MGKRTLSQSGRDDFCMTMQTGYQIGRGGWRWRGGVGRRYSCGKKGRGNCMKAAVYYETGGPEVFRYEELPDPTVRPGGVIIDVKAVGIQGGDLLHRSGGVMATTPHVVGYQAAGVIREAGDRVETVRPGQGVVTPT